MNVMLVDDEAPARAKLRRFLEDMAGVRVVAEAADGADALAWLAAHSGGADALLLDIQMPGSSGLEVAAVLPEGVLVAFCTAFDEFAIRAFELNAVDYLLKPVTRERLTGCVERLRLRLGTYERQQQRKQLSTALHALQPVSGHWLVKGRGAMRRMNLDEVECVCSADNYIELHAASMSMLDRTTLAAFLDHPAVAGRFIRIHRSCAVQPTHVVRIEPLIGGDAQLCLASGRCVRLSRRYREALTDSLLSRFHS